MDTLGTSTMIVSIFREATEGNIERRGPTLGANLIEVSFKWKIERPGPTLGDRLSKAGSDLRGGCRGATPRPHPLR